MTYDEATNVKAGALLLIKSRNYVSTHVLQVEHNSDSNTIFFRCTEGTFSYEDMSLPMSTKELTEIFLKDPKTKVCVYHNNELGEWLFSVAVENSQGFWLDSFTTEQEAYEYIRANHLVVV